MSLAFAAGIVAPATSHGAPERELVVGSEVDYPPFALGEAGGAPDGFTVELWQAVAKEMGFKYRFRVQPFNEILGDFRAGKIDVLINLAYSSERAQFANFSAPHVVSYGTIFARNGSLRFDGEEELKAKSIIVINRDLLHDYAVAAGYRNLVLVADVAAGMRLLNEGKHDAMLVSRLAGLQILKQINLKSVEPVGAPIRGVVQRFGFAVRHGDSDLLAQINEGMAIVRMNGTYQRLYEKWFGVIDPRPVAPIELAKFLVPATLIIFLIGLAYFYQRRMNAILALRVAERTSELTATLQSLRESEARFRCLTEMSSDFYWESDAEHRITQRTESTREAADSVFRRASIIGVLRWEVPHHSPDEAGWLAHRALLDAHLPFRDFEISRHGGNETLIHISVSGDPVFDEAGNFKGYRGVGTDITERKQTEETLRESEERLRAIFDVANAGISIVDRNGKYVMLNNRWAESLGFDSEELKGLTYEDITHPDDLAVARKKFLELIDGKVDRYRSEKRYVRKDSSVFWADLSVSAIKDKSNSVTHVVGMFVDITERKVAEQSLKRLLTEQKAMLENELVGIVTVCDRTIIWANPAFEKMLGYAPGELAGTLTRNNYPSEDAYLAFGAAAYPTLTDGKVFRSQIEQVRKDGSHIWVDVSSQMLNPATGESLWGFIDLTQNRQLEQRIEQSEQRMDLALNGANLGMWDVDIPSGRFIHNPRLMNMLGYLPDEKEVSINTLISLLNREDAPRLGSAYYAHLKGKTGDFEAEYRLRHKDGHWVWLLSRGKVAERDESGRAVRICGTNLDITWRKQAEAELEAHRHHLEELVFARTAELALAKDAAEAANRAKSVFLANMSHELHTPMNGIMGMTDLALRRASDPQQIDWLNKSKASAQRLLRIIDNILDISRIEADQLALEARNFSLAQLIDDALRGQSEPASAKGIGLSSEIAPTLPDLLCGDATRLKQALTNLTGNAIKFSERGQITVRASAAAEDSHSVLLRIEVTDQGIGINPEERARLFQAFTQGDGSLTRKYGGTGLGLIICKRLAMLMGGEVGADSTPGEGSTFWFTARLRRGNGIAAAAPALEHGNDVAPTLPAGGNNQCAADPVRARAVLKQLEPLLAIDDTRAGDLFEVHRPLLLATLGAEAMTLERQVKDFDYPGALATVRKLIRQGSKI